MRAFKHLYIIGNGFDLYHGLPTGYENFATWLYSNDLGLYQIFSIFYLFKGTADWESFEEKLGEIPNFTINNNLENANIIINVKDKNLDDIVRLSDKSVFGPIYEYASNCHSGELADFSPSIVERIRTAFESWLSELTYSTGKKLYINNDDSYFINFNYTDTLERVYGIPKEQILYIHGNVSNRSRLIFGHAKSREEITNVINASSEKDIDADYKENLIDTLFSLRKDIGSILQSNSWLWGNLSTVQDVHIWGHSLSAVDSPYFIQIASNLNKQVIVEINWYVSETTNNGIQKSDDMLYSEGLKKRMNQIKRLKMLGFRNVDSRHLREYQIIKELNIFPKYQSIP